MKKPSSKAPKQVAYDHAPIEKKWQKKWAKDKLNQAKDGKGRKFYSLIEFPYPSGDGLHVGHIRSNTAMDIISRKRRREGYNVLYPIGWDAFGLPTENYAIKTGIQPAIVTKRNTDNFRRQLQSLGFAFDWSREIDTTDPKYYKWTQWIFLKFLEKGLAYKKKMAINWCPKDLIGLANEEVVNGRCERCGTPVEKREKEQWMLKITEYADRLLSDLDATDYVMPVLRDKVNPHRPGAPIVRRRVAHAIVFDPKTEKYLIIRNRTHDWDTVIIGGIEDGESVEETARREVREETGYTDIEFKRVLGGPVENHYFTKHKGENRIAIAEAAYFELKSDTRVAVGADEDKDNQVLWVEPKDFVHGKMINTELPIWLERLNADLIVDPATGVPCFVDTSPQSHVRPGVEFVERNAIAAIVKHWKEDRYIGLRWKKVDWKTLITGGPDGDETPEEGARREVIEETGYLNPKFVRRVGRVDAKFFHNPKGINRHAHFDVMYFELKNGARRELTAEESANHDAIWMTKEEMSEFLSPAGQRYIWDVLFRKLPDRFLPPKPLFDWQERIKEGQRNWIGKSEGAEIKFEIRNPKSATNSKSQNSNKSEITVFTTRPDTLFGVTYVVLAPEHSLVKEFLPSLPNRKDVEDYIAQAKSETDIERTDASKEKTGVELKGVKAINPANGEEVPVWIADYVLGDYGTGAVMAVPAHDERDFVFANDSRRNLPIREVIKPKDGVSADSYYEARGIDKKCFTGEGTLINSGQFNGTDSASAKRKITSFVKGNWVTKFKLRDWVFSRQRYWGEPIPVINCPTCGLVPVPEKQLPVKLPKVENYQPTQTGESPLAAITKWVNVKCPTCKGPAKRETDTMPNWAGSSWYYLRYVDPKNKKAFADPKKLKYWTPVDWYNGGMEHTTLHLLYSRFWHKFLFDLGLVPTKEPYTKRTSHGLILAEGGEKMSKSKGNVINPDSLVASVGADSLRLYEMFMGPFDQPIAWDTNNIAGVRRFIERVWKLREKIRNSKSEIRNKFEIRNTNYEIQDTKALKVMHKTIKKVGDDIEAMRFNTAVSAMMIAVNELEKAESIGREEYEILLQLLAPFAPHVTEELWASLGNKKSIHISAWPAYDAKLAADDEVTIVVQVNGKTRGSFAAAATASQGELEASAKDLPEVKKWLEGKEVAKVIVVPGRLVNIVVTG